MENKVDIKNLMSKIPDYVFKIARDLNKNGFEAYLVGGGVRDLIMGKDPKDYDIGTNAMPDDVLKIFNRSVATGAKFGVIKVLIDDEKGESHDIDVTTYRIEEEYIQGRWPSRVEFTRNIK